MPAEGRPESSESAPFQGSISENAAPTIGFEEALGRVGPSLEAVLGGCQRPPAPEFKTQRLKSWGLLWMLLMSLLF